MSATTRPRAALPRRVYWVRRTVVLLVALALVFGVAQLLGRTGGDPGADTATPVVASPTGTPRVEEPTPGTSAAEEREALGKRLAGKRRDRLPRPEGPCDDSDVVVTPSITEAHAGAAVDIVLKLTTVEAKACRWQVSARSIFLTITSEDGVIWSSQECPGAIPEEAVVPRRKRAAEVTVVWNGRESDADCTRAPPWVLSGSYSASAVARGSVTPVESEFVLGPAVQPTVTKPATPTPSP